MILEKNTVVYNPTTKKIVGEFVAGTDLYPADNCEVFEGTLDDFLSDNHGFVLQEENV